MKWIILHMLYLCLVVNSKPLESIESSNEVIHDDEKTSRITEKREIENLISSFSDDDDAKEIVNEKSSAESTSIQPTRNPSSTSSSSSSPLYNPFVSLLQPLAQRIQFSPQKFFTERLIQLKDTLANLGITVPSNFSLAQAIVARQLGAPNGLIHVAGLNDDGFYTNRLDPGGFFSGNGWFANKGGLLGGPGAIFSTGSILTDYPTPYKK